VLEVRRVNGSSSLKAFAKVRLGCITIHSCRIIQQADGDPWVALPQLPARRKFDGSGAGWAPVVEITNPAVLAALRDAVLAAWRERAP
jgi:DNA-binding cell septation regulator SpoVG